MEQLKKQNYLTATSLTARQINRRIILNIIYRHQPVSRADTARETGLQRSTVSLIVDELINDGWVVEGEHGRIPRGRRPIFLHINNIGAGLMGVHIDSDSVTLGLADLSGNLQWAKKEMTAYSSENLRNALQTMVDSADIPKRFQLKGVGVSLDNIDADPAEVEAVVSDVFNTEVTVESSAIACGKWFLLAHKDAPLAHEHLVSINISNSISLGVIVAGHPLRGAHGRAGAVLNQKNSQANRTNGSGKHQDELGTRLEFAIEAYDPGIILVTGSKVQNPEETERQLEEQLAAAGARGTAVRVIGANEGVEKVCLKGAVAAILDHFLEKCPT